MVDQVINQMNSKSNDSDDDESDDEIEIENQQECTQCGRDWSPGWWREERVDFIEKYLGF